MLILHQNTFLTGALICVKEDAGTRSYCWLILGSEFHAKKAARDNLPSLIAL